MDKETRKIIDEWMKRFNKETKMKSDKQNRITVGKDMLECSGIEFNDLPIEVYIIKGGKKYFYITTSPKTKYEVLGKATMDEKTRVMIPSKVREVYPIEGKEIIVTALYNFQKIKVYVE